MCVVVGGESEREREKGQVDRVVVWVRFAVTHEGVLCGFEKVSKRMLRICLQE